MKERLLLHSCCGPCSTSVIETLKTEFELTLYFYNPNIHPKKEYQKRLEAEKLFCEKTGVELLIGDWDHDDWLEVVKGLEGELEGGARCTKCFEMRLKKTATLAKEKNFQNFATTLSVSPHKSYKAVSHIGQGLEKEIDVKFVNRDFKKKDGFKRSMELSKEHGLYRQNYCGCEFSKR